MRLRALVVVLFFVPVALVSAEEFTCGTSLEQMEAVRELGVWSAARARDAASKGLATASATKRGDVFIVAADDTNTPFRRPFDLEGRTLIFQRQDSGAFAMRNVDLEWDHTLGDRVFLHGSGDPYGVVNLDFDFPFFDRSTRTLYVTGNQGIFLDTPRASDLRQYGEVELATLRQAVIAPLLSTRFGRLGPAPEVYVRKSGNSVAITWVSIDRYSVRATVDRSGEIRFSYQRVSMNPAASAVVITSGSEGWRSDRTSIATTTDGTGDYRVAVPPTIAGMLDITRVSLERVGGLDLYELRITTAAPVNVSNIPSGEYFYYLVQLNGQSFRYYVYADGRERTFIPVWGWNWGSTAARVDGSDVVLTFLHEHIANPSNVTIGAWAYRNGTIIDSTAAMTASLPAPQNGVRTDFSGASERLFDGRPIAEAFSVPVLSVQRVWEQVKQAEPTIGDANIDGVAIYQNFYTDLVTYAGAYSTGGNAGASGISPGDEGSPFRARTPALMHMNTVGYGHNRTSRGASRVVLHEIGHRWLLFAQLLENGVRRYALNPVSAHPAQYVDTRAAFKVYTDTDTSVMGGGSFTDHKNGSFTSSDYGPYGYSWLDLYLMGLAGADEVPPMFYIADSFPALGGEYYAPVNQTYTGTRKDFTVQQVIDATGARRPVYPDTQRQFRVVFVLLADPAREPTESDVEAVQVYRGLMEADFRTATNGRGAVTTTTEPPPSGPRRRAIRR